jgi:hypothetical protein
MSEQAKSFLLKWVENNVHTVAFPEHHKEAERLARRCIVDAEQEGVSESQLEDVAEGDVISYMVMALDRATMAEIDKLAANGD